MKYVLLTCLLSPFFITIPVSEHILSTDLNDIIIESDLIVYARAIDACQVSEKGIEKHFVQFDVNQTLKGTSTLLLSVNTGAVYAGDIPHQLIESKTFQVGQHYLLFLQQGDTQLSLLVNHTLVELVGDQEGPYFMASQSAKEDLDTQLYDKGAMLQSIESFLYNETEILESEILVSR